MMDILFPIILVIAGLCWGSFLNVLIVRSEAGESIIFPFSKCPKCQHPLYWWHNIPILSFLILKGKCYFCNKTISIRYPIIELIGMAIVMFSFLHFASIFDALAVTVILSMFLVMSITDNDIKKISTIQALLVIVCGFIFNRYDIMNSAIGAVISGGIVCSLIVIGHRFFNKLPFGSGDVYLFLGFGAVVGFERLFLYLLFALLIHFLRIIPSYVLDLIRLKQAETLKYLIIYTVACLFLYVSKNISIIGANVLSVLFLGVLIFSAYKLCKNIIYNLKTNENSASTPLSYALAISCLLFLL